MDRVLDQLSGCLDDESARRVIAFEFDAETKARVAALADGANEGHLTEEDRAEYRSYVEMADVITILKLKAKRLLAAPNGIG